MCIRDSPETVLRQRMTGRFECVAGVADFGMVMVDALAAKVSESLAAYRVFHQDWQQRLAWQERQLQAAVPDGILADIPYLTLAAATRLGIPSLAMCSLNWADILAGYCADAPDLAELRAPMLSAYNSARAFLLPAPSMPMPDLQNTQNVGPIAALGQDRRAEIHHRLALSDGDTPVSYTHLDVYKRQAECVMGRYERFWGDKVVGGLARPHGFRRAEPSGVARTWL